MGVHVPKRRRCRGRAGVRLRHSRGLSLYGPRPLLGSAFRQLEVHGVVMAETVDQGYQSTLEERVLLRKRVAYGLLLVWSQ